LNSLKPKIVRIFRQIPQRIPYWIKPLLKPFSGFYPWIYKSLYSSIESEILVKTPYNFYMYINYNNWLEREIANGLYEKEYLEYFYSILGEDDIIIDIGANIGIFSILASKKVKSGLIFSFEPVGINYKRMLRNIEVNSIQNIKTFNLGLSNQNETLDINVPKQDPGESTLSPKTCTKLFLKNDQKISIEKAKFILFDQFFEEHMLKKVDIIKIDVEGAEYKVLKGMKNTLISHNPIVFIELIPSLIENVEGNIDKLIDLLIKYDFKVIYSLELKEKMEIDYKNKDYLLKKIGTGGNFVLSKT
jgi:FkbM family methyltransferase